MYQEANQSSSGGGGGSSQLQFEGFCIDLLKRIAQVVGFQYRIHLSPEGKYGIYQPETGEWNGIVRELMDRVLLLHSLYVHVSLDRLLPRPLPSPTSDHAFFSLLPDACAESGPGHRRNDHQLRQGERHRLYQALHEPGNQHPL